MVDILPHKSRERTDGYGPNLKSGLVTGGVVTSGAAGSLLTFSAILYGAPEYGFLALASIGIGSMVYVGGTIIDRVHREKGVYGIGDLDRVTNPDDSEYEVGLEHKL